MRHRWTIVSVWGLGLVLAGCGEAPSAKVGKVDERVIFGIDDRFNIVDHPDSRAEPWARSVGLLAPTAVVCPGVSECLPDMTFPTEPIGGVNYPLCMDAAFSGESAPDTRDICSAFFVGNQFVDADGDPVSSGGTEVGVFVTAAHCMESAADSCDTSARQDCSTSGVLFDFKTDEDGATLASFSAEESYFRCERVVECDEQISGQVDVVMFHTRPVRGRSALRSRVTPNDAPADLTNAQVGLIGHGHGLPLKAALSGQVRNNVNTGFFYHTVDYFPGNSGGPVFGLALGVVEGIEVGRADAGQEFVLDIDNDCVFWGTCDETGCIQANAGWSEATRMSRFQIQDHLPVLPPQVFEHVVIVLDQSGSMTLEGTAQGLTRWDDAINAAQGWVTLDSLTAGLPRAYSIWTFKEDLLEGGTQNGPLKIWPNPDSTDCAVYDQSTGFCHANDSDAYADINFRLELIRESHRAVTGPRTPLAASMCDVLSGVAHINGLKRIILESDGGENATVDTHACFGAGSEPFVEWDFLLPDWGMTLDSWQAKVVRRATRMHFSLDFSVLDPLSLDSVFDPDVIVWLVDLHFGIEAPLMLASSPSSSAENLGARRITAAVSPSFQAEIDLFRNLGSTEGSTYTEVRGEPGAIYGVDHSPLGDANDDGCVDDDDYDFITQDGVFMTRAVAPNQLAVRADINRDGWVNLLDIDLLVEEWGNGCNDPVPDPPTCSDGRMNASETGVDCGGACQPCGVGDGCEQNQDCETNSCGSQGTCECPAGSNIIRGTEGRDRLHGTSGPDCILGLGGDDIIDGRGGDDFISGGEGDDKLSGGNGNDVLVGGAGRDNLDGGHGNDQLSGGGDGDHLDGGIGDDILRGNDGSDHLLGGRDNDECIGGHGRDQCVVCEEALECAEAPRRPHHPRPRRHGHHRHGFPQGGRH